MIVLLVVALLYSPPTKQPSDARTSWAVDHGGISMTETDSSTTRICNRCGGDPQPLDNFPKDKRASQGRSSPCKACVNARMRGYGYKRPNRWAGRQRPFSEVKDKINLDRFWSKVDVRSDAECWVWTGGTLGRHPYAYGLFAIDGTRYAAHRVAWFIGTGEDIPDGMEVCHTCDHTMCVNPSHFFLGTQGDNIRDAVAKGRMCGPYKLTPAQRDTRIVLP